MSAGCAVAIQDLDLQVAKREAEAIEKAGGRAIAAGRRHHQPIAGAGSSATPSGSSAGCISSSTTPPSRAPSTGRGSSSNSSAHHAGLLHAHTVMSGGGADPAEAAAGADRQHRIDSAAHRARTVLAYAMSKAALENMTRGGARPRRRRRDGQQPRPGLLSHHQKPAAQNPARKAGRWIPAGRVGEPEDAGGASPAARPGVTSRGRRSTSMAASRSVSPQSDATTLRRGFAKLGRLCHSYAHQLVDLRAHFVLEFAERRYHSY